MDLELRKNRPDITKNQLLDFLIRIMFLSVNYVGRLSAAPCPRSLCVFAWTRWKRLARFVFGAFFDQRTTF